MTQREQSVVSVALCVTLCMGITGINRALQVLSGFSAIMDCYNFGRGCCKSNNIARIMLTMEVCFRQLTLGQNWMCVHLLLVAMYASWREGNDR